MGQPETDITFAYLRFPLDAVDPIFMTLHH